MLSQSGPLLYYLESSLGELPQPVVSTWAASGGEAKSTWVGEALGCVVETAMPSLTLPAPAGLFLP